MGAEGIASGGAGQLQRTVSKDRVCLAYGIHKGCPPRLSEEEHWMRADEQTPDLLDETISEIASILARGYMQLRKGRQLDSASDNLANQESEPLTEKGLDSSGHRSLHSFES